MAIAIRLSDAKSIYEEREGGACIFKKQGFASGFGYTVGYFGYFEDRIDERPNAM